MPMASESEKVKCALLIGNSDGIGLELTKRLLEKGYRVVGLSKSASSLVHENTHCIQDVTANAFRDRLLEIISALPRLDLCVYCAGIGQVLDMDNLAFETQVFQVNLISAVITTELVLTKMRRQKQGHFIGLSSIADAMVSAQTPSYNASKRGISSYWEGLGLALAREKVRVTNVRFGFVDTKMAKSEIKPFLLSVKKAVDFLEQIIAKPKIRATKPWATDLLIGILGWMVRVKLLFS
jgi:NAD(P)-dependent dehydrogenase (short-subunit alcohol dehydrogenase family)